MSVCLGDALKAPDARQLCKVVKSALGGSPIRSRGKTQGVREESEETQVPSHNVIRLA